MAMVSCKRRLAHHHGLESPLERLVLLDVLAVLVERGGADAAQIAARQGRLEHVGGVHSALGPTRAHQRVQLVDEQDDLAVGAGDLFQHRLQAILEFAAVLGARDERAQIQRLDALVLERFGHVARGDPLRDALDDGGLAHAGLADEHRVVLGAPGKHLHGPANFLVAADDRIELALAGQVGEVAGVLGQGLVALLGVGIGHALVAAHVGQGLEQIVAAHAGLAQNAGRVAHVLGQHASSRCSLETYSSLNSADWRVASSSKSFIRRPTKPSALLPRTCGCLSSASSTLRPMASPSTPSLRSTASTTPSSWDRRARSRCSGVTSWCARWSARSRAAASAS
jgi:hypothetical protein